MVPVRFSAHALYQLEERGLTHKEVRTTIRRPIRRIQQSLHRYRAVRWTRRGRKQYLLVVIYDVDDAAAEVVTAFLTSKVKKYL